MPCVAPHIGYELLLDLTLTVEQQQSCGALQDQETFEASARTVNRYAGGGGAALSCRVSAATRANK